MVKFTVVAYFQGQRAKVGSTGTSPCMTIPAEHRTLGGTFQAPGWLRLRMNGGAPFFAYARRPPSRASVDVTLPQYCAPGVERGTALHVEAENAELYAARPRVNSAFDWLPHVTHGSYLPVDGAGGVLSIWNQHEPPFEILRAPPIPSTYRMFGLWQAEGTKGETAPDFTFCNTNVALLAHAVGLLEQWGLQKDRLSLEILRTWDEPIDRARAKYAPLGIEIVSERERVPGRGGDAGIIHVKKSAPLLRMARAALAQIFTTPFPSVAAAREYALGWLDGDGNITPMPHAVELRLAGLADEHRVLEKALRRAFGWRQKGSGWIDNKQGTRITLRADEMLDLLDAAAFPFSMNRARLLVAFADRTQGLREGRVWGAYQRWGLRDSDRNLTALGERVCDGYERYAAEIERARQLLAAAPKGMKGVPYSI
jgi:hypothetical protein